MKKLKKHKKNWKKLVKFILLIVVIYVSFSLLNAGFNPTFWSKKEIKLFVTVITSFILGWNAK